MAVFDTKLARRTARNRAGKGARPAAAREAALADEPFIFYAADGDDEGQLAILRRVLGRAPRIVHKVSSTLFVLALALAGAGLGVALVPAPLSRIAAPNIAYRKLAGNVPGAELVVLCRIGGEWGAVQQYLAMLGGRAA
ncbi:LysR substrate-binding domain-containing protein [Burkholderia diffusa]|uniref:LysR family transcriptional regulator n=1 Tax=Burkholderia diffusa TaxID=488732 RepID=A0A6P2N223_9BURK|nr:LysR substrate-binding domain-containing protein [Burkholderia diffusa]VWB88998.1 LysR family transcriptional regulator [Burkholderia diffusa]